MSIKKIKFTKNKILTNQRIAVGTYATMEGIN